MVAITDSDGWVPVTRPEITDIALGGNETNFPGKFFRELASRDKYLYEQALGGDDQSIASAVAFRQLGIAAVAQGRLTLETGVAVSTTDQLAKTVLYYTPYNGNYVALYDTGLSRWDLYQFTERSLSLSGLAANTNYDIFLWNNSGTLTLQAVAWSSSGAGTSTRASAISQLEGIWVKNSDKRRYLGTIRTTATIGQCEDSIERRFVYNVPPSVVTRILDVSDSTSHTYTSSVVRNWNNTLVQVQIVLGLDTGVSVSVSAFHQGGFVYILVNGCDFLGNTGSSSYGTYSISRTGFLLGGSSPVIGSPSIGPRPANYRGITFGYNYFHVGELGSGSFNVARLTVDYEC